MNWEWLGDFVFVTAIVANLVCAVHNLYRTYTMAERWTKNLRPLAYGNGVRAGYIIGKYDMLNIPFDDPHGFYKEAFQVIDEMEAETAWQMALTDDQYEQ